MVLNTNEVSLINNNNNNNITGSGNSCYVPKAISEFVREVSMIRNVSERVMKMDGFVKKLEEEMRKIDAFKRELPITVLLINDAITALKEELVQCRKRRVEPVFEEFIPLKKSREYDGEDENDGVVKEVDISKDKKNWLSSVQLWNNTDNQSNGSNYSRQSNAIFEINNKKCEEVNCGMTKDLVQSATISTHGKTFMPFTGYSACAVEARRKEDHFEIPVACAEEATRKEDEFEFPVVAPLSLLTPATAISMPREEFGSSALSSKSSSSKAGSSSPRISPPLSQSQQQTARKQRRCWSSELHRCFVSALQQLGGSQAATPKQIRDLMQVDGLTNDEVKSHLQKYRLHTRKSPNIANPSTFPFSRLYNTPQDQDMESSKGKSIAKSGSPDSPLRLTETTGGTCNLWVNSMEDADGKVKRSDTNRWKTPFSTAGRVGV